ncbi:hypothetical protein EYC84_007905 [Monilinia fructicola]|uniref:EF-hand domain-containing protein n=1 Tax=Monilinia fructicola TaxID=38448 RepID=A0A5M9JLQ2_MONFR|nr:hypothetical protein EYC84_007905 [Monilinia fructicola]
MTRTDLPTAKEVVKESLLGSEVTEDIQLSAQSKATFEKHSRKDESGAEDYMSEEDFINAIAPKDEDYLHDWGTFENLLAKPDAEYEIAFRLFDVDRTGTVKYDDLKNLYELNKGPESIPFDWNCEWATLYSGGKKRRHDLTYPQFSQMLRDGDGYIEPEDFQRIILETARHKLSDHLLENLHTLCNISTGSKISYANVRAFQNMIREMDLVEMIIRQATAESTDGKITRTDFLNEAARITRFSLFTPMEADILFHFASLDNPSGRLGLSDFAKVLDASWRNPLYNAYEKDGVLESVHHFALGSLAGAFGAFMVYPIDLVKTRMQNQRSSRKVVRNEGFKGLYSGVLPQLVGVAPEKAIKLTVNDLVRGHFSSKEGKILVKHEVLAGGLAGACQVVFTNPLEIVKIRLQVQGEVAKSVEGTPRRSAMWIVSVISLASLKQRKLGVLQLLTAGAIAGMPAAYLTTPCDVIKTRLQVEARKGESQYTSLRHAAKTILKEEGFKAFFKGGPARILRSSPQFGFTLAAYEVLQNILPMPGPLPGQEGPLHYLRSRNALKIILDLDEGFGRVKVPGKESGWVCLGLWGEMVRDRNRS